MCPTPLPRFATNLLAVTLLPMLLACGSGAGGEPSNAGTDAGAEGDAQSETDAEPDATAHDAGSDTNEAGEDAPTPSDASDAAEGDAADPCANVDCSAPGESCNPNTGACECTATSCPEGQMCDSDLTCIPDPMFDGMVLGLACGVDSLRWLSDTDLAAQMDDSVSLGVRWLRFDFAWGIVQHDGRDSWAWGAVDRIVDAAVSRGIRVLGLLHSFPSWVSIDASGHVASEDIAAYATFAGAAVDRYKGLGIKHWEIWNEPNLSGFWRSDPNPAAYTELLKAAYPVIKAHDDEAVVISAGLSPAPDTEPGSHYRALDFLAEMYAAGAKGYFDAVGFHPYSWPLMPSEAVSWNGWRMMGDTTPSLRSIMEANGDGAKKIWMTEYGAPTNRVGEQGQSDELEEAFELASAEAWAGPLLWYSYRDLGTDPDDPEQWFGLITNSHEQKSAYATYDDLAHSVP